MSEFILDDDIDFRAYMKATDTDHKVVASGSFVDDVIDYFHSEKRERYPILPWRKAVNQIQSRPGEVTLWSGFNGSGKSLALGQTSISLVTQRQRVCIASLEMKPQITLARMCRQASKERIPTADFIREFYRVTGDDLLLYDQHGAVQSEKMLAVMRYCADRQQVRHFVLDSFMKCGIAEDDFTSQKNFLDAICTVAKDTGMHVHTVAHSRKGKDENTPPGKMDVKGSGSIIDQVDNVLIMWRNKPKERAKDENKDYDRYAPDALLICDKQRNGEWEGRLPLWFHPESQQFMEQESAEAMDLLKPPVAWL